jgi:hypothetical protein
MSYQETTHKSIDTLPTQATTKKREKEEGMRKHQRMSK